MRQSAFRMTLAVVLSSGVGWAAVRPACGEEAPKNEGAAQPQIVGSTPVATDPSDPDLPPLGIAFPEPLVGETSPFVVHGGSFTWGPNLGAQTVFGGGQSADELAWRDLITPGKPATAPFSVAPAFPSYTLGMLGKAHEVQGEFDAGAIGDIFDAFAKIKAFLGDQGKPLNVGDRVDRFLGFTPIHARSLRSQWGGGGFPLFKPQSKFFYPDFFAFQDIRQRGARLYCAARRAQWEQGGQAPSLGERSAYSFNLLGKKIDLMVLRSTVVLGGPERCTGGLLDHPMCLSASDGAAPSDGAQAFAIPLYFGNTLYAIRGLKLPPIDEVRVPLVLVTGDTEVTTEADKGPVFLGIFNDPPTVTLHRKDYRTVTHADAFLSAEQHFSYGPVHVPLIKLAIAEVFLEVGFNYDVGTFLVPGATQAPQGPFTDDRLVEPSGLLQAWPKPPRKGSLLANPFSKPLPGFPAPVRYHDGAWRFGLFRELGTGLSWQWQALPDGKSDPYWRQPLLGVLQPHDLRALTDDDHRVGSATSASLTGTIGGGLVASYGPFETKLTVSGSLTASVTQKHLLRDALMAQDGNASPLVKPRMRPITAVTVKSDADSSLTFGGLKANLHFHLDLFLDSIDFDKTLFTVGGKPKESSSTESLAKSEEFVLRLGTGSRDGNPMTQPKVLSHLPGAAEFETFDQDVAACLEDPTPNPPPPPPCQEPDDGATPTADVCLYGSGSSMRGLKAFPPGVCANVAGFLSQLPGLSPAQKTCVTGYLGFLCAPTSLQQTFKGQSVVARIWNFDQGMSLALHKVVDDCANAFLSPNDPQLANKVKDLGEHMIAPAVCTAGVKLKDEDSVISVPTASDLQSHAPQSACGS